MVKSVAMWKFKEKNKIVSILKRYGVVKAAVFGSFARGKAGKNSDLDLLVKFGGQKSLLDLASLKIELEDKIRRKVDVLTYNSLHPLLKGIILKEQKKIL
jgi:predicted nucleotidyltransferase